MLTVAPLALGQQLAFPGAEGYGRHVTGGRGGAVIEVTNLNDTGPGSLRVAVGVSAPRTIVFRVSGTIYLNSTLTIKNGNLTIAGQTAPGDGITIARRGLVVSGADNVIIRFIRARLGDLYPRDNNLTAFESDAFSCLESTNIIIDHCSFSWSIDETASCYNNRNFTMQWCIASEALHNSFHPKGNHGYGGIWGGKNATFHHNLLAHHRSRLPRFQGARDANYLTYGDDIVDHRNNVLYNWGDNSTYGAEPATNGFKPRYNIVGNVYKPGPATQSSRRDRILEPYPLPTGEVSDFYVAGNYVFDNLDTSRDNWRGVDNIPPGQLEAAKFDEPFPVAPVETFPALEAYEQVLAHVGCSFPKRDSVDVRVLNEVRTGTAPYGNNGLIDSQDQVGGYPDLISLPAPLDTDHDGMPDDWEISHSLNINDAADRNGDANGNGYTNLEDYLNSLVEPAFTYDEPLTYDAWAPLAIWDPSLPAGKYEDADGDMATNLFEFAFHGDPMVKDAASITPILDTDQQFSFYVRKDTPLQYEVQSSPDLSTWTTDWSGIDSQDNPRIVSLDWGYHTNRITYAASPDPGQDHLFWRVMVTDGTMAP